MQPSGSQIRSGGRINNLKLIRDLPRFYTLALLYEKPRHGYEIISCFHQELGWNISPSLVYPFLSSLERDRLVAASVERGGRGRRVFHLTKLGRLTCRSMFQQFSRIAPGILDENVHTCTGCGHLVLGNHYCETIEGEVASFCCKSCASSYKKKETDIAKEQTIKREELI